MNDEAELLPSVENPFDWQNYIEEEKLTLKPGDILHIKVGIMYMGDNQPPWLPGPHELVEAEEKFKAVVPEGVKVVATHMGMNTDIIKAARG